MKKEKVKDFSFFVYFNSQGRRDLKNQYQSNKAIQLKTMIFQKKDNSVF